MLKLITSFDSRHSQKNISLFCQALREIKQNWLLFWISSSSSTSLSSQISCFLAYMTLSCHGINAIFSPASLPVNFVLIDHSLRYWDMGVKITVPCGWFIELNYRTSASNFKSSSSVSVKSSLLLTTPHVSKQFLLSSQLTPSMLPALTEWPSVFIHP